MCARAAAPIGERPYLGVVQDSPQEVGHHGEQHQLCQRGCLPLGLQGRRLPHHLLHIGSRVPAFGPGHTGRVHVQKQRSDLPAQLHLSELAASAVSWLGTAPVDTQLEARAPPVMDTGGCDSWHFSMPEKDIWQCTCVNSSVTKELQKSQDLPGPERTLRWNACDSRGVSKGHLIKRVKDQGIAEGDDRPGQRACAIGKAHLQMQLCEAGG